MGKMNFTRSACIRALLALGFIQDTQRRGIHDKYSAPQEFKKPGRRPFITIPRHNPIHCQGAILQEIRAMGGKELEEKFLEKI